MKSFTHEPNLIIDKNYKPALKLPADFRDDHSGILSRLSLNKNARAMPVYATPDFKAACWVANPEHNPEIGLLVVATEVKINHESPDDVTRKKYYIGTMSKTDGLDKNSLPNIATKIASYSAPDSQTAILGLASFLGLRYRNSQY